MSKTMTDHPDDPSDPRLDTRKTYAWLGRVNVLRALAAKAREDVKEVRPRSDERRRILSGSMGLWRSKREQWLSRRRWR
jgi:hypothetical protein